MTTAFKTKGNIRGIQKAGKLIAACRKAISERIAPGVTTLELDRFVERFLLDRGATPAQKGYKGYPYAICASVNAVACHGFPDSVPLQSGDIVTIDMTADVGGWKADSAWTYSIGQASPQHARLLKAAEHAMMEGIKQARTGNHIGDIGFAIQRRAEMEGFQVVTAFSGHGIGRHIHEYPPVFHTGAPNTGIVLEEGMVITIEPILAMGSPDVFISMDGWAARTVDGGWTAQFEHTVAVTKKGPIILTD